MGTGASRTGSVRCTELQYRDGRGKAGDNHWSWQCTWLRSWFHHEEQLSTPDPAPSQLLMPQLLTRVYSWLWVWVPNVSQEAKRALIQHLSGSNWNDSTEVNRRFISAIQIVWRVPSILSSPLLVRSNYLSLTPFLHANLFSPPSFLLPSTLSLSLASISFLYLFLFHLYFPLHLDWSEPVDSI